ncbi:alpha/beta fold hydrolase [Actinorugispora endophytica]|uniref:Pimeloyl-ACP methyl ester carboxylesterase n=1 Tax=Actinorugispora endophytica TaxID=1605990 RepID=A0A4R6USZ6_9ACTN|nr:alpha/beta fold hydrolase [Actinorugispora endophytica]TDQ48803.1 pimeloyl-ACP methyl ester carboxylesterase [Actinorugispora endophytica]
MDQTLLDATGEPALRYTVGGAEPSREPPVLLVHGFGSDFELNWARAGWVGALRNSGRRLVGVDLPGHGGSPRPHDPERYTPKALAALLARVLDAVGAPEADVVGYSMGSRLSWQLAVDFPGRVRRAVLGGFGPVDAFEDTDLEGLERGADGGRFGAVFAAAAALPGADTAALAACARGQASQVYSPSPAPDGVPLLFVAGERDGIAEGVESLAAALPAAEVLRLPRRDHRNAVSAQAFKSAATEFLARGRGLSG